MTLCQLIGHKPGRIITGFRNIDAAAITICARCRVPIVSRRFEASGNIMMMLYGQAAVDEAIRYAEEKESGMSLEPILFIIGWTPAPSDPERWIPPQQLAYPILGGEAFLPADAATLQRLLGSERSSISVPHKESVNDATN